MKKINESTPLLSFGLDVKIRPEHYLQSDWIREREPATVCNNPTALAVREALQLVNIPFDEVFAVIDVYYDKRNYVMASRLIDNKDWTFQAHCLYPSSLIAALRNRETFTFKLSFEICNISTYELIRPVKPLWKSITIVFAQFTCCLLVMQAFSIVFLGKPAITQGDIEVIIYVYVGSLISYLIYSFVTLRHNLPVQK